MCCGGGEYMVHIPDLILLPCMSILPLYNIFLRLSNYAVYL